MFVDARVISNPRVDDFVQALDCLSSAYSTFHYLAANLNRFPEQAHVANIRQYVLWTAATMERFREIISDNTKSMDIAVNGKFDYEAAMKKYASAGKDIHIAGTVRLHADIDDGLIPPKLVGLFPDPPAFGSGLDEWCSDGLFVLVGAGPIEAPTPASFASPATSRSNWLAYKLAREALIRQEVELPEATVRRAGTEPNVWGGLA